MGLGDDGKFLSLPAGVGGCCICAWGVLLLVSLPWMLWQVSGLSLAGGWCLQWRREERGFRLHDADLGWDQLWQIYVTGGWGVLSLLGMGELALHGTGASYQGGVSRWQLLSGLRVPVDRDRAGLSACGCCRQDFDGVSRQVCNRGGVWAARAEM